MNTFLKLFAISIATSLAACSVPSITFPELPDMIGGTVTGLTGTGLVLTNNGGDDLSIDSNGVFTFTTPVERGASYVVAVKSQPSNPTQMCSVSHGSGTTGDENVTDVQVNCSVSAFSVGGTVTGLAGTGLVLQDGAGESLAVNADGPFTFPTPVASGASYDVTVLTQPSHLTQECTVTSGTGIIGASNVTDVVVSCTTSKFTIGGTVIGLAGAGLVLQNNGGDDLPISADGGFTFPTSIASGSPFAVTVLTQPSHATQVCTVANGTGTVDASDIVNVTVTCATTAFKIGGTVTGLVGSGLVLQDNGGDDLAISGDGPFQFPTPVASGANYLVTVAGQPSLPTQECTVSGGAGTVDAADVTNVEVTCTTSTFKIGGTVTGLAGSGLVLQDNGGDDLPVSSDGSFQFTTPVASGATFAVTVLTQPSLPTQTCTVVGGTGTVGSGDVTSVAVNCATNRYMIGGTISGLDGTVTLQNNGGDDLDVTSNGTFAFPTSVLSGSAYRVTVRTQPTAPISQTCTIVNATGIVGGANVTDVIVTCTTNVFSIGGTVVGLAAGDAITLRDNGGDDLVRSANGGFTFATPVASGQTYAVTLVANPVAPISQTCTIANGAGTVGNANVTNVIVTCTTNRFTIGGTVIGLAAGDSITLRNNGGDDLVRSANGGFTFPTPVASGQTYAVTLVANPVAPISQTCTVTNGVGTVGNANVTNITVTCTTNAFTIGGTVSGLAAGDAITLRDNGGDDLVRSANGGFTFATPVPSGQSYAVTIVANPPAPISQTCTVANGAGTVGAGNVTNVIVTCTTNRFTIGGTVSGLAGGDSITLRDNGGDDLVRSANGGFTFATPVASGQPYAVTIVANPAAPISQTCTVANGTGTVGNANVTNVTITCTTNAFTIGGTVSGLAAGDSITLRDNGGDDLVRSASGGFTFATPVASGQSYAVTLVANPTSPISQTCTVANSAGTVGNGNVTNVLVTCTTNAFTIGGTVSGLLAGAGPVVLQDNGGDNLTVNANGGFTFPTPVASGSTYAVTVLVNPSGQTCFASNGSGIVAGSNVTNVAITCTRGFSYSATNTNSATQNTVNVDIPIAAGQTLSIGTCGVPGASGVGDTFLRLFDASNTLVAINDDACGLLTFFTFTATTAGTFQVRAGCFQAQSCSGTVAFTLIP